MTNWTTVNATEISSGKNEHLAPPGWKCSTLRPSATSYRELPLTDVHHINFWKCKNFFGKKHEFPKQLLYLENCVAILNVEYFLKRHTLKFYLYSTLDF